MPRPNPSCSAVSGEEQSAVQHRPSSASSALHGAHLNADEEAVLAIGVCHGSDSEHVPEGLPILPVVQ